MGGHLVVVEALIEAGADVSAKTRARGLTPLQISIGDNHLDVARALIKAGSNFDGLSKKRIADLLRRIA